KTGKLQERRYCRHQGNEHFDSKRNVNKFMLVKLEEENDQKKMEVKEKVPWFQRKCQYAPPREMERLVFH
ncbi:hypothetical protein J0S82_003107, partial [Galemys pyrenaicus]